MTPPVPDLRLLLILLSCATIVLTMARPLARRRWWTGPTPPPGSRWRPRFSTPALAAIGAHQWPGRQRSMPFAALEDRLFAATVGSLTVLVPGRHVSFPSSDAVPVRLGSIRR